MIKPYGWSSRKEFTRVMYPKIQSIVQGTGLKAGTALAQAILESSGKVNGNFRVGGSSLSRKANNYFGIKCHTWNGKKYYSRTREENASGQSYYINSCFRAYPSIEASIRDWVRFLQTNKRYKNVFKQNTVHGQIKALKAAGYATGSNYVDAAYGIYKSQLTIISEIDSQKRVSLAIIGVAAAAAAAFLLTKNTTNERVYQRSIAF